MSRWQLPHMLRTSDLSMNPAEAAKNLCIAHAIAMGSSNVLWVRTWQFVHASSVLASLLLAC